MWINWEKDSIKNIFEFLKHSRSHYKVFFGTTFENSNNQSDLEKIILVFSHKRTILRVIQNPGSWDNSALSFRPISNYWRGFYVLRIVFWSLQFANNMKLKKHISKNVVTFYLYDTFYLISLSLRLLMWNNNFTLPIVCQLYYKILPLMDIEFITRMNCGYPL